MSTVRHIPNLKVMNEKLLAVCNLSTPPYMQVLLYKINAVITKSLKKIKINWSRKFRKKKGIALFANITWIPAYCFQKDSVKLHWRISTLFNISI